MFLLPGGGFSPLSCRLIDRFAALLRHNFRHQLTTVLNNHRLHGIVGGIGAKQLDLLHNGDAIHHSTKHNMFPIKMRTGYCGDEELGSIRVGARIGHTQDKRIVMQRQVFICKLSPIDGLSTRSIVV